MKNDTIRTLLAKARKEVPSLVRSLESDNREWFFVPTHEIHRVTQRALRGVNLELFSHALGVSGDAVEVEYCLLAIDGPHSGSKEEWKASLPIDEGGERSRLAAGAAAILDRRVRMALLDIVSVPSEERKAIGRVASAVPRNAYIAVKVSAESEALDQTVGEMPDWGLAAEADAVEAELAGRTPPVSSQAVTPLDAQAVEVWKQEATRRWIKASKACSSAGLEKPDLAEVIAAACGDGKDVDDLAVDDWTQVVIELDGRREAAVQALIGGAS